MKTKESIIENWLKCYTGEKLENFEQYISLCNCSNNEPLFAAFN